MAAGTGCGHPQGLLLRLCAVLKLWLDCISSVPMISSMPTHKDAITWT
jgi:hypothetical protein